MIICSCNVCSQLPIDQREQLHAGDKVVSINSFDSGMIMTVGDGCEKYFQLRKASAHELKAEQRLYLS